jgi:hypothetical protein
MLETVHPQQQSEMLSTSKSKSNAISVSLDSFERYKLGSTEADGFKRRNACFRLM